MLRNVILKNEIIQARSRNKLSNLSLTLVVCDSAKTVDFRFVKKEGKRMYFSGLTFDFTNDKELTIYLALRQKEGTVNEEVFKMKRNK